MNVDLALRIGAVLVAVALIAAPYWPVVAAGLAKVWEVCRHRQMDIARVAGAVILVAVAWGAAPLGIVSPEVAWKIAKVVVGAAAVACGVSMFTPRALPARLCAAVSVAAGGMLLAYTPLPRLPIALPVAQATSAVYVYEKDATPIHPSILAALDKINRERKIPATLFEVDTTDGTGETPEQYRPAVDAAKKVTLPAFVVLSGTRVISAVQAPKELLVP